MLNAGVLTFQEFVMKEPLPLTQIHEAVFEFLRGREDAVLFGAQAVNAYVGEPRMTQDIDLLSTRAGELAGEIREHLSRKFHIEVRVREVGDGKGFRLYQTQKSGNRHLVDLREVETLPDTQSVESIRILAPAALIASKVVSYTARRGKPKAGTGWRDLAMLLLTFPALKSETGAVANLLNDAGESVMDVWRELVAQEFEFESDDEDLEF